MGFYEVYTMFMLPCVKYLRNYADSLKNSQPNVVNFGILNGTSPNFYLT